MNATATYSLNGSSVTTLSSSYPGSDPVKVSRSTSVTGGSTALDSYGSTQGNFGSRSSGYGVYDVTGGFQIVQTITNVGSAPANALFNFYITPGFLLNDLRSEFTGNQYVSSGISFDVQRDGTSVWGSAATLTTNARGTTFNQTGANLYASTADNPLYHAIDGRYQTVDLGVLGAGESIELTYDLSTFASGYALTGADLLVPDRTYVIPDQWIDFAGWGPGYGCTFEPTPPCPQLVPGRTVFIPSFTTVGAPSGSTASSGDPFDVLYFDEPSIDGGLYTRNVPTYNIAGPPTVTFVPTSAVPEPETYALTLSGLGVLAMAARRRRRSATPTA